MLDSAYNSISGVISTLNAGGKQPESFQDFKTSLLSQFDSIQQGLERCGYEWPEGDIQEVLRGLESLPTTDGADSRDFQRSVRKVKLTAIKSSLAAVRADLSRKGGLCYGRPTPGGTSGGTPPARCVGS